MALNAMLVHLERHGSVWCGNVELFKQFPDENLPCSIDTGLDSLKLQLFITLL